MKADGMQANDTSIEEKRLEETKSVEARLRETDKDRWEKFGSYLKELRTARGLTQKEAEKMSGVSVPYLALLERGERKPPSRNILAKLAKMYIVPAGDLWRKAEQAEGRVSGEIDNPLIGNPLKGTKSDQRRIEWAFRAVMTDPQYDFASRLLGPQARELDLTAKLIIVKIYEKASGHKLMTLSELVSADEWITGQTHFNFPE